MTSETTQSAPDDWQPMDTAPKDGTFIYVQQTAVYRWLAYKANSQEVKRGKKGRWQMHNGYGFDTAELEGTCWKNAEIKEPAKQAAT
jgi:hypothetical protein